jgi:hypothetical protein
VAKVVKLPPDVFKSGARFFILERHKF